MAKIKLLHPENLSGVQRTGFLPLSRCHKSGPLTPAIIIISSKDKTAGGAEHSVVEVERARYLHLSVW